jgi:hypothetical protein
MLWKLPFKEPWSKEPMQSNLLLGIDTNPTRHQSACHMTGSLIPLHLAKNTASSAPSLMQSEEADLALQSLIKPSSQSPSEPPWIVWHRSTSWLTEQILDSTQTNISHTFYNASFKDIQ